MQPRKDDYRALPPAYQSFFDDVAKVIEKDRIIIDPVRTFAYGADASFYTLTPKIILRAHTAEEVSRIMKIAGASGVPVTFRAAGTSLSGQAVSDSVLILLSAGWKNIRVMNEGQRIALEPGVIGAQANFALAKFGRKIGPDPASIGSAMIGGIAANNSSGMCCGTSENSYKTVESMKVVLADGTLLDSGDPESRASFRVSHKGLLDELLRVREEIIQDPALENRIREKYKIKNTTGYGLNSLLDFEDPIDILVHLMIGSEGTLGFIAEITYKTVVEHAHKASALVFVPDLHTAGQATALLSKANVSAVELMDRASLRAVENRKGLPQILKSLPETAAALLVETRAGSAIELQEQIRSLETLLQGVKTLELPQFTSKKAEYEVYWDVRRGLLPSVGGARKTGTTVVIEDVAFSIDKLADATVDLQNLLKAHGYHEGIIFGHALDGNLHFVFTQMFDTPEEVERYAVFMDEVAELVCKKYDGAIKAEHGTGRNIAPFVEVEWGSKAHGMMKRIKKAFDPKGILNPDVIITEKPRQHLDNLKVMAAVHELVDKCMECGFCEPKCPSRDLSLSPRQRTVVQREIERLRQTGERPDLLKRFEDDFQYLGVDTCATCGLCAMTCPVGIDTGKMMKAMRANQKGAAAKATAQFVADHFQVVTAGAGTALGAAAVARMIFGAPVLKTVSKGLNKIAGTPKWIEAMPGSAGSYAYKNIVTEGKRKVVYFPSCTVRMMGPAAGDPDRRSVVEVTVDVLKKAGYDVIFPKQVTSLCCGLSFESKGYPQQGDQKLHELEVELLEASQNGAIPILSDTSPCLMRMKTKFDSRLKVYEPIEFALEFLMPNLDVKKVDEEIAIHVTCSSTKMGLTEKFRTLAEACSSKVVVPEGVGCCGFAGDRGLTHPELNAHALRYLKKGIGTATQGYSTSRTCETGLTQHSGVPYRSIMYLIDRVSTAKSKAALVAPPKAI